MNNYLDDLKQCLCPPGNGVYTVHTAQDKKEKLYQSLYGTTKFEEVQAQWLKSLENMDNTPLLLGIPSDAGAGIIRGSNWGPLFVRQEILKYKNLYQDIGDVRVIPHFHLDHILNEKTLQSCRKALYDNSNSHLPVSALGIAEFATEKIYSNNSNTKIFGIGGDHSISYALVKTWIKNQKKQNKKFALIHFDAHTDLLDQRLGIDICFGSWTYHILEDLNDTMDLTQIGIRASGKERNHWEKKFDIHQYWNYEVEEMGKEKFTQNIIQEYKSKEIENIYISFDIDTLDQGFASATGTPESGGLSPDQCIYMINQFSKEFNLTGADLVEVAPFTHQPGLNLNEPENTLESARKITLALLNGLNG